MLVIVLCVVDSAEDEPMIDATEDGTDDSAGNEDPEPTATEAEEGEEKFDDDAPTTIVVVKFLISPGTHVVAVIKVIGSSVDVIVWILVEGSDVLVWYTVATARFFGRDAEVASVAGLYVGNSGATEVMDSGFRGGRAYVGAT